MPVTVGKRVKHILLLQIIFILFSFAGLVSKLASQYNFLSIDFLKLYILGMAILFIYALFWQQILKRVDLSVAYSNRGVVIIWTFLWSAIFLDERITLNNIIGAIIIIFGIVVVSTND